MFQSDTQKKDRDAKSQINFWTTRLLLLKIIKITYKWIRISKPFESLPAQPDYKFPIAFLRRKNWTLS